MSECEIKMEIRQMVNGYTRANEKAIYSIARIIKMRHMKLDKQYIVNLTKNIIKETN